MDRKTIFVFLNTPLLFWNNVFSCSNNGLNSNINLDKKTYMEKNSKENIMERKQEGSDYYGYGLPRVCMTDRGACKFPFTHKGNTYNGCIGTYGRKMCFIRGGYSYGGWGQCQEGCPVHKDTGSACKVIEGPGKGKSCIFPFQWSATGKTYKGCAFEPSAGDEYPWCSTKVNGRGTHVSGGGHWGRCNPDTCPGAQVEVSGAMYSDPVKGCLWGFNVKTHSGVSLEQCKSKCTTAPFACKSLEYKEKWKKCWLSKDTRKTQPNSYRQPCWGFYYDLIYLEIKGGDGVDGTGGTDGTGGKGTETPIEWGQWQSWTQCSQTCGQGTQQRRRRCSGNNCPGSDVEEIKCTGEWEQCGGEWGQWQSWTECSQTCGQGTQQRRRRCSGNNCPGSDVEQIQCTGEWGQCSGQWELWQSWTECSQTCGQGTQQRRRRCSGNNCPGSDIEEIQCTINPKKRRKNIATLTQREKRNLQRALREAIASNTPWRNYQDNANLHGRPITVCPSSLWGICCPHGNTDFLPWHRLFMINTEYLLKETLPYWDWTESAAVPDLWEGIQVPFKLPLNSRARNCRGDDTTRHRRAVNPQIDMEVLKNLTRLAMEETNFQDFSAQIEAPHNDFHGYMSCDMEDPFTAAYDPIFYLHHTYVDYQFAFWQELQRLRGLHAELESPDKILEPFERADYNPYELTRRNSRAREVIDYENKLCYEYDNLIFDGQTPQEFFDEESMRNRRRRVVRRVFVGIVMPNAAPTLKVEFDVCNKQNKCVKGGTLSTFGPSFLRTIGGDISKDYKIIEYEVTHSIKDPSFDTAATGRITSTDEHGILTGLQPVMIWRDNGGVTGGTVYLPKGAQKSDYGKLLDKYNKIIEN